MVRLLLDLQMSCLLIPVRMIEKISLAGKYAAILNLAKLILGTRNVIVSNIAAED